MAHTVTIKTKWVAIAAYVLIVLPIAVFFLGWLRWYIGVPAAAVLVAGLVWIIRKDWWGDYDSMDLPIAHLAVICILFGVLVAFSGISGLGVAEYDIPWRNALLRDLTNYDWPVRYESGTALVYYIAFWLPSALVGKVFGLQAAFVAVWVNVTLICVLSYLLILSMLRKQNPGRMWMVAVVMITWSGMSVLGALYSNITDHQSFGLLGGYASWLDYQGADHFQINWHYRCNYIVLSFVYNQLPCWLAALLMLKKRVAHSYMFIGLCVLPYSPWSFVGILFLLIAAGWGSLRLVMKEGGWKAAAREVLSPGNLAALVTIVPIFALYFLASSHMNGGSAPLTFIGGDLSRANILRLLLFCAVEFVIYMVLISKKYYKDPLFWMLGICLAVFPLFLAGADRTRDFFMGASMPDLFVLMTLVILYLDECVCGKSLEFSGLLLVLALFVGALSPVSQYLSRIEMLRSDGTFYLNEKRAEHIDTFEGESVLDPPNNNFLIEFADNTSFFKYLAR